MLESTITISTAEYMDLREKAQICSFVLNLVKENENRFARIESELFRLQERIDEVKRNDEKE